MYLATHHKNASQYLQRHRRLKHTHWPQSNIHHWNVIVHWPAGANFNLAVTVCKDTAFHNSPAAFHAVVALPSNRMLTRYVLIATSSMEKTMPHRYMLVSGQNLHTGRYPLMQRILMLACNANMRGSLPGSGLHNKFRDREGLSLATLLETDIPIT